MSTASKKVTADCACFTASIAPYIDGELDADHGVDMEAHMIGCPPCAEHVALLRAMRQSLRRTATRRAPAELCARVRATMTEERRREVDGGVGPKLLRLRYAVGIAAAAGVAFAMGIQHHMMAREGAVVADPLASESDKASTTVGFDSLLDELVERHAQPLPPEITDPDQVPRFDSWLGVRVQRPAFQPLEASFKGGRLYPVSDRAYAQLRYVMRGDKPVTVYVFNSSVVPMRATRLDRRVVRKNMPLYYGRLRGYSVAAIEERGVGYAFASDLDADESTKMVMAAIPQ
jgi:anti-sigma factor RsiW